MPVVDPVLRRLPFSIQLRRYYSYALELPDYIDFVEFTVGYSSASIFDPT